MAIHLLWDASALSKRYVPEIGSEIVDSLWENDKELSMVSTFSSYAETFSILLRNRNRGDIDKDTYDLGETMLRDDLIDYSKFTLIPIETEDVLAGIALMKQHNINSADASILASFLRYADSFIDSSILIAGDKRLLRAAQTEGLKIINPELLTLSELYSFVALN